MEIYNANIIPRQATVEGHAGGEVQIYIPTYGYWSPSGIQLTFLTSELPQRIGTGIQLGLTKPKTFRKDASSCPVAPSAL